MKSDLATTPIYNVTRETSSVVKNIVLDGVRALKAEKVTTTFDVTHEINPKTKKPIRFVSKKPVDEIVELMSFDLTEIESEKVEECRKSGKSSFVLKKDGKFYYAAIPNNISFVSSTILGPHMCAAVGKECNRLSAASDEQGGCEKVRDLPKRIEKYPWITIGYETFNTKHDSFVVVNCLHYEKCPPRKPHSLEKTKSLKLGLAMFVWDDVKNQDDVRKRVEQNHRKNGITY